MQTRERIVRLLVRAQAKTKISGQAFVNLEATIPGMKGSYSRANFAISGASTSSVGVSIVAPSNNNATPPRKPKNATPSALLLKGPQAYDSVNFRNLESC